MGAAPAKPASVSTWHWRLVCGPHKRATVDCHTSPDEARPGIRMMGWPWPVTSTVKAAGVAAWVEPDSSMPASKVNVGIVRFMLCYLLDHMLLLRVLARQRGGMSGGW